MPAVRVRADLSLCEPEKLFADDRHGIVETGVAEKNCIRVCGKMLGDAGTRGGRRAKRNHFPQEGVEELVDFLCTEADIAASSKFRLTHGYRARELLKVF